MRYHFACGILEASDLVQAAMIELIKDRIDRCLDVAIVDQMMATVRDVAFNDDIDLERMPMHPPAFVPLRK